jgi:curved DNA-binding protein CbpA
MNFFSRLFHWGPQLESAPIKTLYDLLGARPDDDTEALKKAFRKAVKAHHPDLHAHDPDAPLRLTRIVAANSILRDAKRRATYDRLLQLKREQLRRKKKTRAIISNAVAAAVMGVLVAGYKFLPPLPTAAMDVHSRNAIAAGKQDRSIVTAVVAVKADLDTAGRPAQMAAPGPAARIDTKDQDRPRDARKRVEASDEVIAPSARAPAAKNGFADVAVDRGPALDLPANLAKFQREQGAALYLSGDFHRAIAALDRAIRLDANDAQAYNIRTNVLDEIGAFRRALAGYGQVTRSEPNFPSISEQGRTYTHLAAIKRHLATHSASLRRFSQADLHFGRHRRAHRANICRCGNHLHAFIAPPWTEEKSGERHVSQHIRHRKLLRIAKAEIVGPAMSPAGKANAQGTLVIMAQLPFQEKVELRPDMRTTAVKPERPNSSSSWGGHARITVSTGAYSSVSASSHCSGPRSQSLPESC